MNNVALDIDSQTPLSENASEPSDSYHHGNLKSSLVETYLELLETLPPNQISLRKLASHVGVAATAVYNHFANKDELTTAVRVRLLHHFADFTQAPLETSLEPEEALFQLSRAYYAYSVEHKSFFDILFSEKVPEEFVTEELVEAGMRAEKLVHAAVSQLLSKHGLVSTSFTESVASFACWSLSHGVSTLAANRVNQAACLTKRWPEELLMTNSDSIDKTLRSLSDILVAGIIATANK